MVVDFTPGPWRVIEDEGGYTMPIAKSRWSIEGGNEMTIAVLIGDCVPEHDANARLIAAAPALYEAAKIAIRDGVIYELREAVALAEGGLAATQKEQKQ